MPKLNKKTQPRPKTLYRVTNWSEYDKALMQRGSITFWMSEGFEKTWLYTGEKQRGSQFDYSDQAILVMLTVKEYLDSTAQECAYLETWQFQSRAPQTRRELTLHSQAWAQRLEE